jgi:hypothetical protein
MSETSRATPTKQVELFVCSGCDACNQATTFMKGWTYGRQDVDLKIVPILSEPERAVRLGINHTPALVSDGELLAQNLSVEVLAHLLWKRFDTG